ncbi:hypothetical protein PybrP1_002275 [[Pythium] brassicae (nom. inval.)]|nr:hypothetical protein PybrP1_002275 [[Pythium] brassicae (nom. inval.)]
MSDAEIASDVVGLEELSLESLPRWRDMTEVRTLSTPPLFAAAAKELKVGQLVHPQEFSLFDSMSALELMDPKMDSGMLVNGAPPQSIAARLRSGAVPLAFPSARDVLATLDELFRCEAGWLSGQPLQQTLLTNVYMHRDPINALVGQFVGFEDLLANADVRELLARRLMAAKSAAATLQLVMAAVCLVVLKTNAVVRDAVVRGDIYEEEDFSPANGFDIGILEALSGDALTALLDAAEQRLAAVLAEQQQRVAAAKKGGKKKGSKRAGAGSSSDAAASGFEPLHTNPRVGVLLCEALLRRVRFRRSQFEAFSGLGTVEAPVDLERARAQFAELEELLRGLATEQLELDAEVFGGKPLGVDRTISRLLLSGSPPREVKLPSFDEALAIEAQLVQQMGTACSPAQWASMEELRIFLADFSREQPSVVVRSYMLLFLYMEKKIYGKYSFTDWLSAAMVANGVPSVLLSTQEGVVFSSRKVSYPRYFTAWTLEETALLMIHYVLLGIELDLYAPSEYGTIYWYLDYLHGSRLQNLNVTWQFVEKMKKVMPARPRPSADDTQAAASSDAAAAADAKAKTAKPSKAAPTGEVDTAKARFLREINYNEMQRSMMRAYFQLFNALEREGHVQTVTPTFGSALIRFEHRFAAFRPIHFPAALTHEDYAKNSDFSPYDVALIYKSADECFKVARAHGEALLRSEDGSDSSSSASGRQRVVHGAEVEALMKAAIANSVALVRREQQAGAAGGRAKKSAKSSGSATAADAAAPAAAGKALELLDFSTHPHFPVVSFPDRKA